ncbi:MAG: hypothetical protein K2N72_02100, partial [Oscillospiraceae bacterium]|nr:hypothetical protein [Oscillospiraceae bacterium]
TMDIVIMVVSIVYLIIDIELALKMTEAAQMKGHDSVTLLCFLLGPASYFYVVALPDLKLREQNEEIIKAIKEIQITNTDSAPVKPKYSNDNLPDL